MIKKSGFAGMNVQPDPIKFVSINDKYWPEVLTSAEAMEDQGSHHPNWMNLGYHFPPGCAHGKCSLNSTAVKVCHQVGKKAGLDLLN